MASERLNCSIDYHFPGQDNRSHCGATLNIAGDSMGKSVIDEWIERCKRLSEIDPKRAVAGAVTVVIVIYLLLVVLPSMLFH
jgi:hypothetical protein